MFGPRMLRWPAAIAALLACSAAGAVEVPDSVVRMERLAYGPPGNVTNTQRGLLSIDLIGLRQATGIPQGYINVSTGQGWMVRNLVVLDGERFPYQTLSTPIDLGDTVAVNIPARIDYSPTLAVTYTPPPNRTYELIRRIFDVSSADATPNTAAPRPPNRSGLTFDAGALTQIAVQLDHRNIEAAKNAGWPTAVANSLDYLRRTTPLPVPHPHREGLEDDNASLVGFVGRTMRRPFTSRRVGGPVVAPLEGKLNYLAAAGLHTSTESTHHGSFGSVVPGSDVRVNVSGREAQSLVQGLIISKLIEAVSALRTSCEGVSAWPGGSRVFNIAGVGTLGGNPLIFAYSDIDEIVDDLVQRTRPMTMHFLTGPDPSGIYSLDGSNEQLRALTCTRVLPLPSDLTVINTIDPAGHTPIVPPPPSRIHVDEFRGSVRLYTPTGANEWHGQMLGTRFGDGTIRAASTTTVAGRPNVRSEFVGRKDGLVTTGRFTVGAGGELNGTPIAWDVRAEKLAEPPRAHMRVNGYGQDITVEFDSPVQFSVGLEPGRLTGQTGEFWLVAILSDGSMYSFDLLDQTWRPGLRPVTTGTLSNVPAVLLPPLSGLPAGNYDVYFGYDTLIDGQADLNTMYYQATTLRIVP